MTKSKDNDFLKSYWFWVGAIVVIVAVFFYIDLSGLGVNQAKLVIKFDNGKERVFQGQVVEDMTVLQSLEAASRGDDFKINYFIDKDRGLKLASIGGTIDGFNGRNWKFYLNKNLLPTDQLDKIKIKSGDLIEVVFE